MKRLMTILVTLILLITLTAALSFAGGTLDAVKKRGYLVVGCNSGQAGFSYPDSKGVWKGLDVDFGHALAAAVLGDKAKVKYVPLTSTQRFTALQSGEIDILARNTTHTAIRGISLGANFLTPIFYDGTGFLVSKALKVKSAKELDGATFCLVPGSTTEMNVADYFAQHKMKYKQVLFDSNDEVNKAFLNGRCDCIAGDRSSVAGSRIATPNPDAYMVLPEVISKEPLAPAVRHGDDQWFDIASWALWAMINAEELGITSENVDSFLKSNNPKVKRFLGVDPKIGKALGLDPKWAYNIVKQVGNYGECYERNVGPNTPLGLDRGLNKLWSQGGLMYSPPFR